MSKALRGNDGSGWVSRQEFQALEARVNKAEQAIKLCHHQLQTQQTQKQALGQLRALVTAAKSGQLGNLGLGGSSRGLGDRAFPGPIERERSRTPRSSAPKAVLSLPDDAPLFPTVEEFAAQNGLDQKCVRTLMGQPIEVQMHIMGQGPLEGGSNPSAMVMSRIAKCLSEYQLPTTVATPDKVEEFIASNGLDEPVGMLLREQSDECKTAVLSLGPVDGRNPSAMVQGRIKKFLATGRLDR